MTRMTKLQIAATAIAVLVVLRYAVRHHVQVSKPNVRIYDVDLGELSVESTFEFSTVFENHTLENCHLVGVNCCCGIEVEKYPKNIDRLSSSRIIGKVHTPLTPGRMEWEVTVFFEQPHLKSLVFQVRGDLVGSSDSDKLDVSGPQPTPAIKES